jgi:Transcription factor Pcc1
LTVRLRAACDRPATARALRDAVRADTPGFVGLRVRGSNLEVEVHAASAASARATLDDLLACLKAAEQAVPSSRGPVSPQR